MRVLCALACVLLSPLASAATTANGTQLPAQARIVSYRVWCYDAGVASLRGRPGVLDVVRAIRRKPFAEWVTVAYDPTATDPAALLTALREQFCPKATQEQPVTHTQGETIARLDNPLSVRGDCLALALRLPSAGTMAWTLPEGWTVVLGPTATTRAGDFPVLIQTLASSAAGRHRLAASYTPEGGEAVALSWEVELVDLVGRR